ncbi:transglycosylase domain-containing protein [Pseudomonas berkeleyensis]|uniref:peptidoglycan glycosyltransferase n=1 Tax=Pseudomonas berkeleyensis TaxID=2726956 RepID=A0A7G5DSY9_9PSED|nr:transglycosylase domain-containing protein [Pseudomonas berkeleyensis]QMV64864.1 penicillin-binding protein [Pseudomonas berkeleyensis]WSO40332.1 transglycosylase domain-containing protein [Pseudomonas berkeleyensis]
MGALWQSDPEQRDLRSSALPIAGTARGSKSRRWRLLLYLLLIALLLVAVALFVFELRSAHFQARELSRYAASLTYQVEPGPSPSILYPSDGPFDKRQGYAYLPLMLERLQQRDFLISAQSRFSPELMAYSSHGLFPPFVEKSQSGLSISDCRGTPFYEFHYPQQGYADFASIPPLVVSSLLFIENRYLLDPAQPQANPAVDWPRFAMAALSQLGKVLDMQDQSAGGSTLATQLEKYRHSPDGLTLSAGEKLRQMISASVRAYQQGPQTLEARQNIVRDYLNSVPLSAAPGHGEVHGLADGLRIWYGADFERSNALLDPSRSPDASLAERGLALRQMLSLMIAQRRPSYYLAQGRKEMETLTESHIRLLASGGLIDTQLRDAALSQKLHYRDWQQEPNLRPVESDKGISVARSRLSNLLGMPLYDLDRLDLAARSTLQRDLQQQTSAYLQHLADPEFAGKIGLFGDRLLSPEKTAEVRYSFTLFERTATGSLVRVQTDSTDQPFDINEGSKLELGSTAKLRVLATYLEIIAELHQRHSGKTPAELRALEIAEQDHLSRWAVDYLRSNPGVDLASMLDAALERRYSANPHERFFTGGGVHTFGNFRREDNGRNPTLRESLRESINLPFVRLMRDLVRYSTYQSSAELLKDDKDPRRQEYLQRFADREGRTFLLRFWRKYQGQPEQQRLETFLSGLRQTSARLAAVHRYLIPNADEATFAAFLRAQVPQENLSDARITRLYNDYGPGAYSLPDQGYIARVHPLELWLLGFLIQQPQASFSDAVAASVDERQEVYGWLFRSRHKSARDSRIRIMLEVEAFSDIHRRWKNLGYPFQHLVPSLATALGSSGDRPAALAELMGIIQNDGIRQPVQRIDELHFAAHTPYETRVERDPQSGKRVMPSEVAAALRGALSQVVEGGTARRLQGSFRLADGQALTLGGKTGTGDNRIESVGAGGRVLSSRAMNRTATFVFFLGSRHYGTLTAFVPGREAERFTFTSALPVQVLKGMAPILTPYLEPGSATLCQAPLSAQQASWQ